MWSYSGNPAASAKDMVRFRVGDKDSADPLVTDEEIAAVLAEEPDTHLAAAEIAEALAAAFARKADVADGDVKIAHSQRATAFERLAGRLRTRRNEAGAPLAFAGGLDAPARAFTMTTHDNTES